MKYVRDEANNLYEALDAAEIQAAFVAQVEGKELSSNDFTDHHKEIVEQMETGAVTGVKGDKESAHRTGQVNLTPENLGASEAKDTHTNLLNPTLQSATVSGVTVTNNGDGTYTMSGTATGWVTQDICTVDVVEGMSYRLLGCPSGGSGTTYRMGLYTNEASPTSIIQDWGSGRNWTSDRTGTLKVRIVIQPSYAISGSLTFKPMLTRDLNATYDDFVAYSGDGEINENVAELYNGLKDANNRIDTTNTNVAALATSKQDKLTFDTTPTAGSTNPVTSGGVKTALDAKQNAATAITTSNISSQSVAYASEANYAASSRSANFCTSADTADSVPWTGVTGKPVLVEGYSGDGAFWPVHHMGKFTDSNNLLAMSAGGNLYWSGAAWSDKRLKKNIKDTKVEALDKINKIHLVEFDFKNTEKYGSHKDIGYIAQELKEIVPDCVLEVPVDGIEKETYETDTLYMVEDKHIIPYLVKAVQELSKDVDALKAQVKALKKDDNNN